MYLIHLNRPSQIKKRCNGNKKHSLRSRVKKKDKKSRRVRRERRVIDFNMSSGATNSRVIFWEKVELRETISDDKGIRTQKESDIW